MTDEDIENAPLSYKYKIKRREIWIWENHYGYDGGGGSSDYYFASLEEAKGDFFTQSTDKDWRPCKFDQENNFERGSRYGGKWVHFKQLKAKR